MYEVILDRFEGNQIKMIQYLCNELQYDLSDAILTLNQLPKGLVGNLFCNKNFQFKTAHFQHRIKLFIQVNNIFNVVVPILAFEQTRFDYKNFQLDKFAPRYILGRPMNGSLQLIYQLN